MLRDGVVFCRVLSLIDEAHLDPTDFYDPAETNAEGNENINTFLTIASSNLKFPDTFEHADLLIDEESLEDLYYNEQFGRVVETLCYLGKVAEKQCQLRSQMPAELIQYVRNNVELPHAKPLPVARRVDTSMASQSPPSPQKARNESKRLGIPFFRKGARNQTTKHSRATGSQVKAESTQEGVGSRRVGGSMLGGTEPNHITQDHDSSSFRGRAEQLKQQAILLGVGFLLGFILCLMLSGGSTALSAEDLPCEYVPNNVLSEMNNQEAKEEYLNYFCRASHFKLVNDGVLLSTLKKEATLEAVREAAEKSSNMISQSTQARYSDAREDHSSSGSLMLVLMIAAAAAAAGIVAVALPAKSSGMNIQQIKQMIVARLA